MAGRPTIEDIAREAGVSVATVDRVLNGRSRVREETARKVSEAAHRIGYHARNLIDQRLRADLPEVRLGFVLQKEKQHFYQAFRRHIEAELAAVTAFRPQPVIEFSISQSPSEVSALLRSMADRVDVVGALAVNHTAITDAVVDLRAAGVPTVALLSDFAQGERLSYLGTNNLKVGRIAAWMLATSARKYGKIALFVGGHRWHGHELRETGFRSYFREYNPQFELLDTLVNLETRQLTYEATLDLLSRHPDVTGIYLAGGGMEGAIQALREEREPGQVSLVVNELTPDTRAALADRYVTMVIATPLPEFCRELIRFMGDAVLNSGAAPAGQVFMDSILHVPESVQ